MDELSLLLRALLAAGRADAATAAALVVDGTAPTRLQLSPGPCRAPATPTTSSTERFRPLARYAPDLGKGADLIGRAPVVARKGLAAAGDKAHARAKSFFSDLDGHVGAVVEDDIDSSPLIISLPAA